MENQPGGFFIETVFRFDGVKYGVLRTKDYPLFVRYVQITHQNAQYTDWITISDSMESLVKNYYIKYIKKRNS